jgi:ketosteroid isomerase-like protein
MSWTRLGWALAGGLAACAHGTIPGTSIEDTEENRQILSMVDAYEKAMEGLDASALLTLVSPTYYEDYGTREGEDDENYAQLAERLQTTFDMTETLRLDLRVDVIEVEEEEAYAEFFYSVRSLVKYPSGEKWETHSDRARLELKKQEDGWRIVAGL